MLITRICDAVCFEQGGERLQIPSLGMGISALNKKLESIISRNFYRIMNIIQVLVQIILQYNCCISLLHDIRYLLADL